LSGPSQDRFQVCQEIQGVGQGEVVLWESIVLESPILESLTLESLILESPTLESLILESPILQSPTLESIALNNLARFNGWRLFPKGLNEVREIQEIR